MGPRFVDQRQDPLVVGKVRCVEGGDLGDVRLEAALTRQCGCRQCKYTTRVRANMREKGFDQKIGPNKSPVQIDDQR